MKLLLIKSEDESHWGSCKVISPNLHALYKGLSKEDFTIEWFEIPQDLVKAELISKKSYMQSLAERLAEFKPDRLIFIDHLPVPPKILAHLSLHMNLKKLPPLIFHIYGDFTYFSGDWLFLNNELTGHKIEFIVASNAQKRLVEEFLEVKNGISQLCFPVNDKDYFYDLTERELSRKSFGLVEKDFVLIYSGRISLQKNVDILIDEYLKLRKITGEQLKLWVIGSFDDVGADLLGYSTFHGYMFSKIQNMLEGYSEKDLSGLKFWGHQSKTELRKLKSAADFFISLSVYHDEDYGMSPAESLATGLPTMLTDWGGYSSFASNNEWSCGLVPVQITEYGLELETSQIDSAVKQAMLNQNQLLADRKSRSESFLNKFSINSNVIVLDSILKKNLTIFSGFNWLLEQYSSALEMNWSKKKLNKFLSPDVRGFYNQVYKNYISANNGDN